MPKNTTSSRPCRMISRSVSVVSIVPPLAQLS
jgi:hypothetical protein